MKILINICFALLYLGIMMSVGQYAVGNGVVFFTLIGLVFIYAVKSIVEIKEKYQILLNLGLISLWLTPLFAFKHLPMLYTSIVALVFILSYYLLLLKNNRSRVFVYLILLASVGGVVSILDVQHIEVNWILNLSLSILFFSLLITLTIFIYFKIKPLKIDFSNYNLSGIFAVFSIAFVLSFFNLEILPPLYTEMSNAEKMTEILSKNEKVNAKEGTLITHQLINEILNK